MHYSTKGVQGLFVGFKKSDAKSYRWGFNGKEKQDEISGAGNSLDFGARIYDSRLGRWLSVDPKAADAPGWSPYRAFFCNPIQYSDPDGQWEWDNTGNLKAQKGDNSYSMAKFLGTSQSNAMHILNKCGVTANSKGVLNLKEGQSFAKDNLWVGLKAPSGPVVNNTAEAKAHYDNGSGKAADVGDQSTSQLLGSDKFQTKLNKITSEKVQATGYFSVNMTDLPGSFHIGNTGVDYSVTNNGTSSAVTFTLFTNTNKNSSNKTDGFWDPNFVAERTLGKVSDKYKADEMGPNLEWEGTPYPYKTRKRIFFFKPVEEKK
jgi:RHS repeat-associated protein